MASLTGDQFVIEHAALGIDARQNHVARTNVTPHEFADVDVVSHQYQGMLTFGFEGL